MKLKNILMTAAIALTGVATVNAATPTYNWGDLVVGLSQTGNTQFYEVDLGNISALLSLSAGQTATYTALNSTDMQTVFGSNWANDNTVSFGIIAAGNNLNPTAGQAKNTVWVTSTDTMNLLGSSAESNANTDARATLRNTSGDNSYNTLTVSANDSRAVIGTASGVNSWNNGISRVSTDYSYAVLTTSLTDSASVSLDLYQMTGNLGTVPAGTAATKLGTFTLSDSGVITYEAVPEPSTYALLGLGGLGMLRMFRRRRA